MCYASAMTAVPGLLERTRVVLHHPFFPENLGSVARAMHNTGLSELHVVEGPALDHPNALKLAVNSSHLLAAARAHDRFEAAIEGVTLVIGTTAHPFDELRFFTPRQASRLALGHDGPVALVFGNEKNGLTIDELRRCHAVVRIPCLAPGASLNLAQAAMIVCYEWLSAAIEGGPSDPLVGWTAIAPPEELDALAERMTEALTETGFFKPHNAAKKRGGLRRMLGRLQMDPAELDLMRGLVHRLGLYFERHPAEAAKENPVD